MKYRDLVYGEVIIKEPLVIELIISPSFQRLKGVDQYGYRPLWVNPSVKAKDIEASRFRHSLGIYLLLKKFNAPFEEQIAGLVHDVSHTTFSHCIDYALSSGSEKEQNHQDNVFQDFILKSEIPVILRKYNLNPSFIFDDSNFPLKEKKLPDLCADRIDYSLRDGLVHEILINEDANYFLGNLTIKDSQWVFKNYRSAEKFAKFFNKINSSHYSGFLAAVMFRAVGDYLKYSIEKGYIHESDFYTTDKEILAKIEKNVKKDKKLQLLHDRLNKKVGAKNNPKNYEAHVFCKSRVIDPLCLNNGVLKRVSKIEPKWKKIIAEESKPKEYFIKFER